MDLKLANGIILAKTMSWDGTYFPAVIYSKALLKFGNTFTDGYKTIYDVNWYWRKLANYDHKILKSDKFTESLLNFIKISSQKPIFLLPTKNDFAISNDKEKLVLPGNFENGIPPFNHVINAMRDFFIGDYYDGFGARYLNIKSKKEAIETMTHFFDNASKYCYSLDDFDFETQIAIYLGFNLGGKHYITNGKYIPSISKLSYKYED